MMTVFPVKTMAHKGTLKEHGQGRREGSKDQDQTLTECQGSMSGIVWNIPSNSYEIKKGQLTQHV